MAIDWKPTLAAVEAAPGVTSDLGKLILSDLSTAGSKYDQFFAPGSPSVRVESADHLKWSASLAPFYQSQDRAAQLVEQEATRLNGSPVFLTATGPIVLAPDVAMPLTSRPDLPETPARSTIGAFTFQALDPGPLGNQITVSITTIITTITIPGTPPVTLPTGPQSTITLTLGSYRETLAFGAPSKLVSAGLAGSAVEGTVGGTLSGGTGEAKSIRRRLERALTLPGQSYPPNTPPISDGVLNLARVELAKAAPPEPGFFDARYYQPAVLPSRRGQAPELISPSQLLPDERSAYSYWIKIATDPKTPAATAAIGKTFTRNLLQEATARAREAAASKTPVETLGAVESALVGALSAAQAWLAA